MYELISVDDHIIEPPRVWSDRLPAKYQEAGPHVIDEAGREWWVYEGNRVDTMGLNAVAGKPQETWNMDPVRYTDMIQGCWDPVQRAKDMALDGVVGTVCLPDPAQVRGHALPSVQGQGTGRPVRAGLQRLAVRRVVRGRARPVHPHDGRPAVGPEAGGGGDPAHRRPRRAVHHVPGDARAARLAVVVHRPLGSGVGGAFRDRPGRQHAHRDEWVAAEPRAGRALPRDDHAGPGERRDRHGRHAGKPGAAQVPRAADGLLRGRPGLDPGAAGAVRPDVGAAPDVVQPGRSQAL